MVKFDVTLLRYLTKDDFRTLTAIEQGMKNHEMVPVPLIESIAKLKRGGVKSAIKTLHKNKLVWHDSKNYDGYKLTYQGYDFLAIKAMVSRGSVSGIGQKIGVGKESDIFVAVNDEGQELALKLHRLGRISFRNIKQKRDYLKHRKSPSWIYLSRLAALKEFAFMKALYDHGFPVPKPIDCSRHCVLMSLCNGCLLAQVKELKHVDRVYNDLMDLILRLASAGLIHCDYNEFNIMIDDEEKITLIDFPQMISTSHQNAEMYFDRDVQCIRTFFSKRFGYETDNWPKFDRDVEKKFSLDVEVAASGFSKEDQAQLDQYRDTLKELNLNGERAEDDDEEEGEEEESEEEDEEESEGEEEEVETDAKEKAVKSKPTTEKAKSKVTDEVKSEKSNGATGERADSVEEKTPEGENNNESDDEEEEGEGEPVVQIDEIRKRIAKGLHKRQKFKVKRNAGKSRTKQEHRDIIKSYS